MPTTPWFRAGLALIVVVITTACPGGHPVGTTGSGGTGGRPPRDGGSGGGLGSLGSNCDDNVEVCNAGLTCLTQFPQGYCTAICTPGVSCQDAGSCVQPLPGQNYCALGCSQDIDCTRAGFGCDPTCKVCVPASTFGQISCGGFVVGGGGHAPDGGRCGALPALPGPLTWTASRSVSASAATYSESEAAGIVNHGSVVAAYMAFPADAGAPQNWLGRSLSTDNGQSFGSQSVLVTASDDYTFDPTLGFDGLGTYYLAFGGFAVAGGGSGQVWVSSSSDGVNWQAAQNVLSPGDIAAGGGAIDKPFLAIDPQTHTPVIAYADVQGAFGGPGPYRVRVAVGVGDGGAFGSSSQLDDGLRAAFRDLPTVAFDRAGNLYAAWVEALDNSTVVEDQNTGTKLAGNVTNSIYVASKALTAAGVFQPATTPNTRVSQSTDQVVVDAAHIAVSADASSIFVGYTVETSPAGGSNSTDIEIATSTDHGKTFSRHVIANDDPGCATHFHPALFADLTGRLWVSWVDNRDGQGHVFYTWSSDSAVTFHPAALLSDTPFYFTTLINSSQSSVPAWLGGYQGLFGDQANLYALWTGAKNGTGVQSPAHVYLQQAVLP